MSKEERDQKLKKLDKPDQQKCEEQIKDSVTKPDQQKCEEQIKGSVTVSEAYKELMKKADDC